MCLENQELKALEAYRRQMERIEKSMRNVKYKIAILSGKGGVGKSVVAANLACTMASKGFKTGILDADITGPSIPKILGVRGSPLTAAPIGIMPVKTALGLRLVSMDLLLPDDDTPVIWRGPLKSTAIRQFLGEVLWGELDYLFIDLPPGTGDEALTVARSIPNMTGVVIVTTPSDLSFIVVRRAVGFAKRLGLRILGIVENMSGFICPRCGYKVDLFGSGGGRRMAEELGLNMLGEIPIDPELNLSVEMGKPIVIWKPDSPASNAFVEIAERLQKTLENVDG
ncbi:ATP-binding protein [Candidatus Bathyarchaeota archaeon]|nr:MAG: ATP-binding protein [Candidatus Bathyarchaeota archaeon]